jgi:hypothetical protein
MKVGNHADSHSILNSWRNHYCHLLNVTGTSNVRQIELNLDKPLVSKSCAFKYKMVTGDLKRNKSPGTDQLQAELLQPEVGQCNPKYLNL